MIRRVVVTGLGMVTPLGNTVQTTWENLLKGRNGVGQITYFDTKNHRVKIAAQVKNFNPTDYMSEKDARHMDFHQHYIIAAAKEAIADAHLELTEEMHPRTSAFVASSTGGLRRYQEYITLIHDTGDPRKMTPYAIPMLVVNAGNNLVAMMLNAQGPSAVQVSACATGADNIGHAFDLIRTGRIDRAIAGCSDYPITDLGVAVFDKMRAYTTSNDAETAMRPFDRDRSGMVFGEGCGAMVIEALESAKERGATIYAELVGYGSTTDAFHRTAPEPQGIGASEAIRLALSDAKINPEQVGYINAHGTGTYLNDPAEVKAVKRAFGDYAYKVPLSSTKSMTGHAMGATAAIEAAFTVLALKEQVAPPTIHLDNPAPDCDLDFIPHQARQIRMEYAMTNAFGFGGHNASLVFKVFND